MNQEITAITIDTSIKINDMLPIVEELTQPLHDGREYRIKVTRNVNYFESVTSRYTDFFAIYVCLYEGCSIPPSIHQYADSCFTLISDHQCAIGRLTEVESINFSMFNKHVKDVRVDRRNSAGAPSSTRR